VAFQTNEARAARGDLVLRASSNQGGGAVTTSRERTPSEGKRHVDKKKNILFGLAGTSDEFLGRQKTSYRGTEVNFNPWTTLTPNREKSRVKNELRQKYLIQGGPGGKVEKKKNKKIRPTRSQETKKGDDEGVDHSCPSQTLDWGKALANQGGPNHEE